MIGAVHSIHWQEGNTQRHIKISYGFLLSSHCDSQSHWNLASLGQEDLSSMVLCVRTVSRAASEDLILKARVTVFPRAFGTALLTQAWVGQLHS